MPFLLSSLDLGPREPKPPGGDSIGQAMWISYLKPARQADSKTHRAMSERASLAAPSIRAIPAEAHRT